MKELTRVETIKGLREMLPELEEGRETHRDWRDCDQVYRDRNPDIGDEHFHAQLVNLYDCRISMINAAIQILEKSN